MKNSFKSISIIFCMFIIAICLLLIRPNIAYADWEVENFTVSNIVVRDGIFTSFDLHFQVPDYLGTTRSWLGIQTKMFENNDLKDNGTVYSDKEFSDMDDVADDYYFKNNYGIEAFSNEEGFKCFGSEYNSINESFSGMRIPTEQNGVYYIYLWTKCYGVFYPDSLIGTVTINNGTITIADSDNSQLITGDVNTFEAKLIEKIEIEGVNVSSIKIDEEPTFTGSIKNYSDKIDFFQAFMSVNRASLISNNIQDSSDEDGLIKNYKYFYIGDIIIKDNSNLKFSDNTKLYVNGIETDFYYDQWNSISFADDEKEIIPEGYIEPAKLNEDFEEEQKLKVNDAILKAMKEGKVKYREENAEQVIKEAFANGQEINVEIEISEATSKSVAPYLFGYDDDRYDIINAIDKKVGENQVLGAYYTVDILVFIDGYYDVIRITELTNPISITIPLPNGLSQIKDGYEREWKVIRHHNGNIVLIDANQTENGISFLNDKYSEFAVVYEDTKIEKSEEEEVKESEKEIEAEKNEDVKEVKEQEQSEAAKNISNPKTGDNIIIWFSLMSILTIFTVAIIAYKKRKV